MSPRDFLRAARVPRMLQPQDFGLWHIERIEAETDGHARLIGGPYQTVLRRATTATIHLPARAHEIVMEDSTQELSRHLPIWLSARGRVLVTGLGLGCVVRGLLASPDVEHIDVVELDRQILRVVGAEFNGDRRVDLHQGDALTYAWRSDVTWDFAWHDLWCEGSGLHLLHGKLLHRYRHRVVHQGAWQLPRPIRELWRQPLLGSRRRHVRFQDIPALFGLRTP